MSDEGVHEIQLNGKQLVFMFMAVTVVAVVIFLCGVMVGRGVRAPRAAELADATTQAPLDPTAAVQSPAPTSVDATAPAASTPGQEKLTYADRLTTTAPPTESLKEPVTPVSAVKTPVADPIPIAPAVKTIPSKPTPAEKKPAANEPKASANVKLTEKPVTKPVPAETGEGGFVVQVAAVKARSEADTIAKRLASKGFRSYVTSPSAGAAPVYRVRVGKFSDRREAETVARRLEKEEQFKPWITR